MELAPLIFSVSKGKGLYVPLIGSGVSTGAGIPTGHQVLRDLLDKLARLAGVDPSTDLDEWYATTYGQPPTYSGILEKLTQTPAERAQILLGYFEASAEDRELQRKLPTRAHRALARLARLGYVRIVLTTNFDSLIEQAMRAEGLDPVMITRPDDIAGLPPLSHLPLCVAKLHGDYRDYRTLNTAGELAAYDGRIAAFVQRILSDYGLVVSGWSGEHDPALLGLVRDYRAANYGTYWTHRGNLTAGAAAVVEARGGKAIPISDADAFLGDLADGVEALERSSIQASSSADILIARLKQYLQADDRWIDLSELVGGVIKGCVGRFNGDRFRYDGEAFNKETLPARILEYETIMSVAAQLLMLGAHWGRAEHEKLWLRSIKQLVPDTEVATGNTGWIDLADYPAVLGLYAVGIGAISSGRAELAVSTLKGGTVRYGHEDRPWILRLHPWFTSTDWFRVLPGLKNHRQAISERLWQVLRPLHAEIGLTEKAFDSVFDEWELLLSMASADERERASGDPRTPVGRFAWKHHQDGDNNVLEVFRKAIADRGRNWTYLRAGLCGGDPARALGLLDAIAKQQELRRFGP